MQIVFDLAFKASSFTVTIRWNQSALSELTHFVTFSQRR